MSSEGAPSAAARWGELFAETAVAVGSSVEARWLVEEASGGSWPAVRDEAVTVKMAAHLADMIERRRAGEPLQYVVGHWGFRHLDVMVDRRVLIPRPETEVTVEVALAELDRTVRERPRQEATIVDLGTGSGAIALAVATERVRTQVWATDASKDALAVASANLAGTGGRAAARVRLAHGAWWEALPADLRGAVDLAVANPPYIATAEMTTLDPVVADWEPRGALEAGPGGLEDVAEIVADAGGWLRPGAALVVEIAPHQAEQALALAEAAGLVDRWVAPDLAGRARVLVGRRPSDQQSGRRPSDQQSGRRPSDRQSCQKPTGEQSGRRPAEEEPTNEEGGR